MIRRALGLAAAALVLCACNVSTHVKVNPDGSGTYSVVLTAPKGPGNTGSALYDSLKKAAAKSSVPLKVEHYSSGTEDGAQASLTFRSLADLEAQSKAVSAAGGLGGVTVSRDDKGWHFDAASAEGLVKPPGEKQTGPPGGVIDASKLGQLVRLSVVVELPGAPALNNATAVTHTDTTSSFTWDLSVGRVATGLQAATAFVGDQATVRQASAITPLRDRDSDSSTIRNVVAGLVLAVLLAAVVAGAVLLRRRTLMSAKSSPTPSSPTPSSPLEPPPAEA